MNDREQIEQAIRMIIASESSAFTLSDKLFTPGGLFSKLGRTETERREVTTSPLFREAQARFRQLQKQEITAFRHSTRRPIAAK